MLEVKKRLLKKLEGEEKEEEKEKKPIEITYLKTDEFIIEQIVPLIKERTIKAIAGHAVGGGGSLTLPLHFLKYSFKTKESKEIEEIEIDGTTYKPIQSELFDDNNTLIFPSGVDEYESDYKLIKEIREYVHYYLQVKESEEWLIVYFVLLTWLSDQFPFTAYLHFVGITGSGKSRAIEVVSQLCYKSIQGSGSVTVSSIFRLVNMFQGTLILNEFEIGSEKQEGFNEKMQILKAGSEDYVVFRVEGEGKKKVESFKLKGPKVFAGEHTIENAALESRMIVIPMSKKTRPIPLYKTTKFKQQGEALRRKLLMWRFRHINKVNLEEFEYGVDKLKGFDSRIQQVMTPLYILAEDDIKKKIVDYITIKEEEVKSARREEIAGKVFEYIVKNTDMREKRCYWQPLTEEFKEEYTPRKLSNIVRRELGLDLIETGHDKVKHVPYDDVLFNSLKDHYGIEAVTAADTLHPTHVTLQPQKVRDVDKKEEETDEIDLKESLQP